MLIATTCCLVFLFARGSMIPDFMCTLFVAVMMWCDVRYQPMVDWWVIKKFGGAWESPRSTGEVFQNCGDLLAVCAIRVGCSILPPGGAPSLLLAGPSLSRWLGGAEPVHHHAPPQGSTESLTCRISISVFDQQKKPSKLSKAVKRNSQGLRYMGKKSSNLNRNKNQFRQYFFVTSGNFQTTVSPPNDGSFKSLCFMIVLNMLEVDKMMSMKSCDLFAA